jgi:hypothetical protein
MPSCLGANGPGQHILYVSIQPHLGRQQVFPLGQVGQGGRVCWASQPG